MLHGSDDYRFIAVESMGIVKSYTPRTLAGDVQTMVDVSDVDWAVRELTRMRAAGSRAFQVRAEPVQHLFGDLVGAAADRTVLALALAVAALFWGLLTDGGPLEMQRS